MIGVSYHYKIFDVRLKDDSTEFAIFQINLLIEIEL